MNSAKKARLTENVLIRLCDKFTRTEVNVICPVMKAENSVRVLYKCQRNLLESVLKSIGEKNGLTLESLNLNSQPNAKEIEGNLFVKYSALQNKDLQRFREELESELSTILKGKYVLVDEMQDSNNIVPQPAISEADFEVHKMELCYEQLHQEAKARPDIYIMEESIKDELDELKESYTKFAVLSQNGKGKSFILNLLLMMTADNQEEYARNNKAIQLPPGFPDNVSLKHLTELDPTNLPNVVKDFIKDSKDTKTEPVFHYLQYFGNTEASLKGFSTIGNYFSKRELLDLEPYVLPQKDIEGAHESTTKCIIHLRYGSIYQMKVEYFDVEELQQQLFELFTMKEDSVDKTNSTVKDKAVECLERRYEILTDCQCLNKEKFATFKDINLSEEVLSFAGKTELYVGKGELVTQDRLALLNTLKAFATSQEDDDDKALDVKKKIAALKQIVVYLPSKILLGQKQILEMPGTDDSDPIAMDFIRNALAEVDGVIVVTEHGFKICEKEVKEMLSEGGFLKKFENEPLSNKIMLLAYPEKNLKWQFKQGDEDKIKKLENAEKRKKEDDLLAIKKMLNRKSLSSDLENSIFTSYILPVLHSSILSQKDSEHEVITKHSSFLSLTGIQELFMQLDKSVTSKQILSYNEVRTKLEHFQIANNFTSENANAILLVLNNGKFDDLIKKKLEALTEKLNADIKKMLDYMGTQVEEMFEENIHEAEQRWNAEKENVTVGAYSPYFCGNNPIYKVRLFHTFFSGLENKKEEIINKILEEIEWLLTEYKESVTGLCTQEFCSRLHGMDPSVSKGYISGILEPKLMDVLQWYIGKKKRPFNKKVLEKLMHESQKQSLKSIILLKNFKKCSLDEAKENTSENINTCMMNVKDLFMQKLIALHNYRFNQLRTHLWSRKRFTILKQLEVELKIVLKDKDLAELNLILQTLTSMMSATFAENDQNMINK